MSFQEGPYQKLFFHLKESKNYKKVKMKRGLSWMTKYRERGHSLFNGNHFSSSAATRWLSHTDITDILHAIFMRNTCVNKIVPEWN